MKTIKIFFKAFVIFLIFQTSQSQVVINEFSASNYSGFQDNFLRYEDWIELYNTSATPFNLSGYYLSDRQNNPTKWQFPAGTIIPGNGFLRVWASGRDIVAGNHIHTNFKLTQRQPNPEYVVFADPMGNILESYHLLDYATQTNHSWGRTTNGGMNWGVFTNPTPGASNTGTSYLRYAVSPVFSLSGGFYPGSISVSLSTTEPNSIIRYTTNGNTPDATSTVYSGPINITTTTVLQARVYSNNPQILPGFYEFHTYFINVSHTIPVVSIAGTNVSTLLGGSSSARPHGCVEYYENGQLKTKVTGEFNKHGNDSWAYQQRGIDFISRDQFGYGDALRHKIFAAKDRQRFQRVIFKAAANDNYPFQNGGAHIRDAYIHELSIRSGLKLDERTYEPCVLYVNGQYWGVYETREKVDDPDFTEYYYDQDRNHLYYLKTWGSTWAEYGGNAATTDWNNLRNFIQNNYMGDSANYAYVKSQLNLMSLIDYFIINTHTVCSDWLNWNTGWWRGTNPNGEAKKWRYTLWDMDATFGHYINYTGIPNTSPNADPCFGHNLPNPGGQGHTTIIKKLYDENQEFKLMYLTRYFNLINGPLHCDNMILVLDELINRITPEMPAHIARWGGNMTTWQNNVQAIRNFILQRCINVEQAIADCFGVTGPYNITVLVDPPGAGSVDFNLLHLTTFPFTDSYYSTIVNTLKANAYPGFTFSHWEFQNHTPSPSTTSDSITVSFNNHDTIIAHFTTGSHPKNITLLVMPPGSGQISINSFTPTIYPWSGDFPDSTNISLQATPNVGYVFVNWSAQNHTLNPATNVPSVGFQLLHNDTIIAFFEEFVQPSYYNLQINVMPPGAGEVILNNNTNITTTYNVTYNNPTNISLQANAASNYVFSHWGINHHQLLPSNESEYVTFFLTQNEIVTAYFDMEETGIYLPVSFTPNGDGLNDYFSLHTNFEIAECEIMIFSRWGQLIFQSKDPAFAWDGTFNGNPCQIGTYVYVFKYLLKGSEEQMKILGSVSIIK